MPNAVERRVDAHSVAERQALDPAVFKERCRAYGDDASRPARDAAEQELVALHRDLSAMRRNPLTNALQIEVDCAKKVRERAAEREVLFDVHKQSLLQQQTQVENDIDAALQPPRATWVGLGAELRAMLRTLPEDERYRVIERAQGTDDYLPIVYAIASAPAALSGVAAGKHLQMRNIALALKNPALLRRPADIKQELTLLAQCEEGYRRSIVELVDFDKADALKRLAEPAP